MTKGVNLSRSQLGTRTRSRWHPIAMQLNIKHTYLFVYVRNINSQIHGSGIHIALYMYSSITANGILLQTGLSYMSLHPLLFVNPDYTPP